MPIGTRLPSLECIHFTGTSPIAKGNSNLPLCHCQRKGHIFYIRFYRLQPLCSIRCRVGLKLHHASGATKEHPPKTSITLPLVNRQSGSGARSIHASLRNTSSSPDSVQDYSIHNDFCQSVPIATSLHIRYILIHF